MSTRHAILGVLMQCPGHGYRIKKLFAPFVSKNGLNDGQVYPILSRLEKEGLVRKEIVHQRKSPSKNIYHITERGREEFMDWLTGSVDETDPIKYDLFMQYSFLMKCNFFEHLSKDERVKKLKTQIESANQKILDYERMSEEMRARNLSDYKIRIVNYGIESQRLKIKWINDLLKSELGKSVRGTTGKRKLASARIERRTTSGKG